MRGHALAAVIRGAVRSLIAPRFSYSPITCLPFPGPLFTRPVKPEERAKAVADHFPELAPHRAKELERVVASAIQRAVREQLCKLELEAARMAKSAQGYGRQAKFRDPAAIHFHNEWARRFRELRTGKAPRDPLDLTATLGR